MLPCQQQSPAGEGAAPGGQRPMGHSGAPGAGPVGDRLRSLGSKVGSALPLRLRGALPLGVV